MDTGSAFEQPTQPLDVRAVDGGVAETILELNDAIRAADRDVDGIVLGSVGDILYSGADLSEIEGADLETATRG